MPLVNKLIANLAEVRHLRLGGGQLPLQTFLHLGQVPQRHFNALLILIQLGGVVLQLQDHGILSRALTIGRVKPIVQILRHRQLVGIARLELNGRLVMGRALLSDLQGGRVGRPLKVFDLIHKDNNPRRQKQRGDDKQNYRNLGQSAQGVAPWTGCPSVVVWAASGHDRRDT